MEVVLGSAGNCWWAVEMSFIYLFINLVYILLCQVPSHYVGSFIQKG